VNRRRAVQWAARSDGHAAAGPADVELRIERIVLDGVGVGWQDRTVVADSVASELGRLLAGGGWNGTCAPLATHSFSTPELAWSPADGAEDLGVRIARAVYGGLSERIASGEAAGP
jgi:hypothetical protein